MSTPRKLILSPFSACFIFGTNPNSTDTNLSPHQYQWLGSAYYFGYLAFSLPNAYFLQKFPLKRYLGACILVWGVMLVLMSVFRTFAGLCFCRVALGMSEGVITVSRHLVVVRLDLQRMPFG
jgi:MFS family permease